MAQNSIRVNEHNNEGVKNISDVTGTKQQSSNKTLFDVAVLLQAIATELPSGYSTTIKSQRETLSTNVEGIVLTYTVPANKEFAPGLIEFSGSNFAEFTCLIDSVIVSCKRTYWADFNGTFNLSANGIGIFYPAGTTIEVKANNYRPYDGVFDVMLIGIEKSV